MTKALIERLRQRSETSELSPVDDELARNVTGLAYAGILRSTRHFMFFVLIHNLILLSGSGHGEDYIEYLHTKYSY